MLRDEKVKGTFYNRIKDLYGMFLLLLISSVGWAQESGPRVPNIKSLYQEGRYAEIIQTYEGPEGNAVEALYLGLSYLRTGNPSKAIPAWKRYVQINTGSEGHREISQYLTLLVQAEAKRTARAILQQEKDLAAKQDPRTIAVFPFQNLGQPVYAPLSKGLAAMIITDLSKVKTLKVVERVQINAILNELKLAQSGLVDNQNAPRAGLFLGAGKITLGSFLNLDPDLIHLNTTVMRSESSVLMTQSETHGNLAAFYQLQKELVFKILCGVGHCPEGLDQQTQDAVGKIHTRNFKAFLLYSQGLEYMDQGQYQEAARAFFLAVEEDPEFELARRALLETPLFPLDQPAIIARAEGIQNEAPEHSYTKTVSDSPPILQPVANNALSNDSSWDASFVRIMIPPVAVTNQTSPSPITPVQVEVQFRPLLSNGAPSSDTR